MFRSKHFPCDYRDDLYVSRISGARRMGKDKELIQNPIYLFLPPLMIINGIIPMITLTILNWAIYNKVRLIITSYI